MKLGKLARYDHITTDLINPRNKQVTKFLKSIINNVVELFGTPNDQQIEVITIDKLLEIVPWIIEIIHLGRYVARI